MMKCAEIQELLYDFLTKRLNSAEYQKVKAHINICKHCSAELKALAKDLSLVDKVKVPEIFPGFEDRIRKRIKEKSKAVTLVIILQFIHKHLRWKMIRHNGTPIPQPITVALTPEQKAGLQKIGLPIAKKLPGCYVTGTIYEDTKKNVYLHLKVQASLGGKLIPQLHAILRDEKGEEILSQFSQDGTFSFEGLTQGKYSIEFIKDERIIGNISMDLRG